MEKKEEKKDRYDKIATRTYARTATEQLGHSEHPRDWFLIDSWMHAIRNMLTYTCLLYTSDAADE